MTAGYPVFAPADNGQLPLARRRDAQRAAFDKVGRWPEFVVHEFRIDIAVPNYGLRLEVQQEDETRRARPTGRDTEHLVVADRDKVADRCGTFAARGGIMIEEPKRNTLAVEELDPGEILHRPCDRDLAVGEPKGEAAFESDREVSAPTTTRSGRIDRGHARGGCRTGGVAAGGAGTFRRALTARARARRRTRASVGGLHFRRLGGGRDLSPGIIRPRFIYARVASYDRKQTAPGPQPYVHASESARGLGSVKIPGTRGFVPRTSASTGPARGQPAVGSLRKSPRLRMIGMILEHLSLTKSLTHGCFALLIALPLGCDPADSKREETPASKSQPDAAKKGAEPKKLAAAPKPADDPVALKQAPSKPIPLAFAKTQPCTITTKSTDPKANLECFEIRALQVAGHAQRICFPIKAPYTLEYDDKRRILNDGLYSYEHAEDGNAKSTWIGDGKPRVSKAKFDASARMVQRDGTKFTFDESGRLIKSDYGKRFTAVKYADDGTFTSDHNYPDSDEECESNLFVVTKNEHGQTLTEEYGGCEINEASRTLTFTYDAAGRPTHIDIELTTGEESDGSVDATVDVSYACHD